MESTVFERLVQQLNPEEKQKMLSRLTSRKDELTETSMPMEAPVETSWELTFQNFGWFRKLTLYIKSIFLGHKLKELVEDRMFSDLGFDIERRLPGMFNSRIRMLHPGFYEELRSLFEGLKVFTKPIITAFGPHKGDFFAFLVGMEMQDIQDRLMEETSHWKIYETNQERPNKEIKAIVDANLRLIMDSIPSPKKRLLFESVKSLYSLKQLCAFSEEKLLSPFQVMSFGGTAGNVSLDELKGGLLDLWERLMGFDTTPPFAVLEGLFIFYAGLSNPDGKVDGDNVEDLLKQAHNALTRIKEFRQRVPLGRLVCFAFKNLSLQPRNLGGVEDWFVLYKNFWRGRVDTSFEEFSKERNQRVLLAELAVFLDIQVTEFLSESIYPPYFSGQIPTPREKAFKFYKLFWQRIFIPKINPVLRQILLEGDFYRKQNKASFSETYNFLLKVQEKLTSFQKSFSNDGEWGKMLTEARALKEESLVLSRVKDIYLQAGDWVDLFLKESLYHIGNFAGILEILLKGDQGGKVEVLSNLGNLGGRNTNFRKDLEFAFHRWEKFQRILTDLYGME